MLRSLADRGDGKMRGDPLPYAFLHKVSDISFNTDGNGVSDAREHFPVRRHRDCASGSRRDYGKAIGFDLGKGGGEQVGDLDGPRLGGRCGINPGGRSTEAIP